MKKKYVAILMGIVMTAAVLNGCGQKEDTETISLSDIATGDTVSVVLDADGNATSIMVQSMGGGMGGSPS